MCANVHEGVKIWAYFENEVHRPCWHEKLQSALGWPPVKSKHFLDYFETKVIWIFKLGNFNKNILKIWISEIQGCQFGQIQILTLLLEESYEVLSEVWIRMRSPKLI